MIYYLIASVFYIAIMLMTFTESIRLSKHFIWINLFLNICSSFLWFTLVKNLPNKESILLNSAYWDLMIMFVGYILPIFIFQFKLNYMQLIGLFVIFVGFCLLKAFND
jgi:drug/metabolite transporter (DMT)-like permease